MYICACLHMCVTLKVQTLNSIMLESLGRGVCVCVSVCVTKEECKDRSVWIALGKLQLL